MTRYLGLDLGSVTCGVSESDTGFIAHTVKTIRFKPEDYATCMDLVIDLVNEKKHDLLVMGYPLMLNDDEGPRAKLCREFGEFLEEETGIRVVLQDERWTTSESENILLEADLSRKKRKKKIDQMAAVAILQRYLDSHQS